MARKFYVLLYVCALLIALTACTGGGVTYNGAPQIVPAESNVPEQYESSEPIKLENTEGAELKSLVVYFSWSGNTESVAAEIAKKTGADIYRIEPETPYTDSYDKLLDIAKAEQRSKSRPVLAGDFPGLDGYSVIYLGYPIWWADMPMIVYTFLDECDFSGKMIAPFCTSGSSGLSNTVNNIKSEEPNAIVLNGLHIRDSKSSNSADAVREWLEELNLTE
jgi:flavodoxin